MFENNILDLKVSVYERRVRNVEHGKTVTA